MGGHPGDELQIVHRLLLSRILSIPESDHYPGGVRPEAGVQYPVGHSDSKCGAAPQHTEPDGRKQREEVVRLF